MPVKSIGPQLAKAAIPGIRLPLQEDDLAAYRAGLSEAIQKLENDDLTGALNSLYNLRTARPKPARVRMGLGA